MLPGDMMLGRFNHSDRLLNTENSVRRSSDRLRLDRIDICMARFPHDVGNQPKARLKSNAERTLDKSNKSWMKCSKGFDTIQQF